MNEDGEDPEPSPSPDAGRGLIARVGRGLDAMDRLQQRHRPSAVAYAVVKKFGDDDGARWAALVTYYGFLSLFPLLLVLTTVLGFLAQGNDELRDRILDSALSEFPIVGDQIRSNVGALSGSVPALLIGLVVALWGGMGVVLTLEAAMDDLWDVPRRARPGFLPGRLRALVFLVGFGAAVATSALVAELAASAGSLGWGVRLAALAGTLLLHAVLFGFAFRFLTVAEIRWRTVIPGAVVAGVGWIALLSVGTWLVDRQLRDAEELYGFFGIVLGALSWIYLGAQLLLLSAELNVVLERRLWPRSLRPPPLTDADRRAFAAQAMEAAFRPGQEIHVHFEGREEEERTPRS